MAATQLQPLMSTEDLGDYLGISADSVRKMRRRDAGLRAIGIPVGKNIKYRPEDVQTWLDERRAQANQRACA